MADWGRVRLIGPHPVRLARTAAFLLRRNAVRRRLRRHYDRLVVTPRPAAALVPPKIGLDALERLPPALHAPARAIVDEAELVLAHKVDYLGSGLSDLGPAIDWHADFKSGYRWEPRFYQDVEMTRLDDASDAKVPWELSRGHQLLTLARAARFTGDRRYGDALQAQLGAWLESNPPGRGINWTTPMELGFRVVNWLWVLGTLEPNVSISAELRSRVAHSLQQHARHIALNLEGTPYLRSNHYLGNILALLAVGAAFPGDRAADRWFGLACRAFEREIVHEVHPDGVGFEGSLSYHGLSLEMFLLACHIATTAGRPLSERYRCRLRAMVDVVRAARHPDGRIPLFGDQDSGRVLPAGFTRQATHDHLAWTAAGVLGDGKPLPGSPHPEVAWNIGLEAWTRLAQAAPMPAPPSAFRHGGLYVLDGGGSHVVVRCGGVGQNGAGGHAHNDLLSFELSRGGPIIVDSGTYAYTFDIAARNLMRASAAHNVTVVNGEELNPIDPRQVFQLRQVALPRVELWIESQDEVMLRVSHNGYQRLDPPVLVRRTFRLTRASGELTVCDEMIGSGVRQLESYLHFPPGTTIEPGECAGTYFVSQDGQSAVEVAFVPASLAVEPSTGWYSDRYGHRERAPILVAGVSAALPASLQYTVTAARVEAPAAVAGAIRRAYT